MAEHAWPSGHPESTNGAILDSPQDEQTETRLRTHLDCTTLTELVYNSLPDAPALGRIHHYAKGEMLWNVDDHRHDIYFLKRGQVAILLNDASGCDLIVRVIKPGELFGELCFCYKRNQPRENCAEAVIDSEVLRIDLAAFLAYLRRNSGALESFTFVLCERLADSENRIEVLSHRGAESRLCRLLLQLAGAVKAGNPNQEIRIKLPVGHQELARMAAMTRPHVSVIMGKLRDRGLIDYARGRQLTVRITELRKYLVAREQ